MARRFTIEGRLLEEVNKTKPPDQSLSVYVRAVLESDVRRPEAAAQYVAFVAAHPEERGSLAEWDRADLSNPPRFPLQRFWITLCR